MKHFFKTFFISLTLFAVIAVAAIFIYMKNHSYESDYNMAWAESKLPDGSDERSSEIVGSRRINVLLAGLEDTRTDTIMLATYDKAEKKASVISIPRDTHYSRKDMMYTGSNKINSINSVRGIDGLKSKIEEILGIPVHNYVSIDYDGVRAIVDAIGGVEVDIPFYMKYDDPFADPPLHIDFQPGLTTLNGDNAIEFLRFRHGNPGYESYPGGDLDRIKAQQGFILSAAKKAIGPNLPAVISSVYPYVDTDFSLPEALSLAMNIVGMDTGNIDFYTLPGSADTVNGGSFFFYDEQGIKDLVDVIYGLDEGSMSDEILDATE